MLSSIWKKTIYEKRWNLLAWQVGIFAMTLFIMALFPTLKEAFGQSLANVPDSLKSVLGDASTYQRINGFIDIQVMFQMVFMTVIYGVILFTGVLAGDEGEGTLQTLLAHPVSRKRIYFEKLLGSTILLGLVSAAVFFGVWLGALMVGESVDVLRLALAVKGLFLVSFVFSVMGFALGAITGRRGLAGAVAGAVAFFSYLVTNLAPSVKSLETLNKFSPYEYFNKPSILDTGVQVGDWLILAITTAVFIVLGFVLFVRRDIPPK